MISPAHPETSLEHASGIIEARLGLYFPPSRLQDLERGLAGAAKDFGLTDASRLVDRLVRDGLSRQEIEILAGHLTVGETYFFREKGIFEIFEKHLIPAFIRQCSGSDRRLRIWSAGCCTGEEPYSIAMALDRQAADLKDWNITILATDINPRFLGKASEGIYNEWSFRDTPSWVKEKYFQPAAGGKHEISPAIKQMVTFGYLNLAEDVYPALLNNTNAMDVVFCRNVLMYFERGRSDKVIRKLHRSLVDGGWLIVSPSEASQAMFPMFQPVSFPGGILYRKPAGRPDGTPEAALALPPVPEKHGKGASAAPVHPPAAAPVPVFLPAHDDDKVAFLAPPVKPETAPEAATPWERSSALFQDGKYAEAAALLEGWCSLHPGDAPALALLARAQANLGRLDEAGRRCDQALAADKLNPRYQYLKANILEERGKPEEAWTSLKRVIYLDPNFVLAHFSLGNLASKTGRRRESERHFRNALNFLAACPRDEVLPESEGITAGRLLELVRSNLQLENNP